MMSVLSAFATNTTDESLACAAVVRHPLVASEIRPHEVESWHCLFMTIAKCCLHPSQKVRQVSEEVFLSVLTNYGCIRRDFGPEVWDFFVSATLPILFPSKGRVVFFQSFFNHLVFEYIDVFRAYFRQIFELLCKTVRSAGGDFAVSGLQYIEKFVISEPSLVRENVKFVTVQVKQMLGPVATVNVVTVRIAERLIAMTDTTDDKSEFIAILTAIAEASEDECCICAAHRSVCTAWLAAGRIEGLADHLKLVFECYVGREERHGDWDGLAAFAFREMMKLEDDAFVMCVDALSDFVGRIIESESLEVRKVFMDVLRRRLFDVQPAPAETA
jgi:hypothetical protein